MRISDWSSDVCSSDLFPERTTAGGAIGPAQNITDGFDQAPGRPQPHHRAEPQQIASARGQHAFYRTTQRIGHARGYIRKEGARSEEHTSELQSLMRISYAVFCLKKKKKYTVINKQ